MFSSKPRKVSLTLFCYFALVLALATVAQADVHNNQARDHVGLSRMLRKRADLSDLLPTGSNQGTSGAANDPPNLDSSSSAAAAAASATSASDTQKDASTSSTAVSTSASTSSSVSSSPLSDIAIC